MDSGYTASEYLVNSKTDHDVEIIGPVRPDPSWQFKAGQGFDTTNFVVDWDNKVLFIVIQLGYGLFKALQPI